MDSGNRPPREISTRTRDSVRLLALSLSLKPRENHSLEHSSKGYTSPRSNALLRVVPYYFLRSSSSYERSFNISTLKLDRERLFFSRAFGPRPRFLRMYQGCACSPRTKKTHLLANGIMSIDRCSLGMLDRSAL